MSLSIHIYQVEETLSIHLNTLTTGGDYIFLSVFQVEEAGRGGIDDLEATLHRLVELVHPRHYLAMQVMAQERYTNGLGDMGLAVEKGELCYKCSLYT